MQGSNGARLVSNGVCCVANSSLKEDICTVNGAAGKCAPATNNCMLIEKEKSK